MKRLYFCLNIWKKDKEDIALLENKKVGKGCFKPSEHILCLNIFPPPSHGSGIIRHSFSNFCPGFLINQVGMSEGKYGHDNKKVKRAGLNTKIVNVVLSIQEF